MSDIQVQNIDHTEELPETKWSRLNHKKWLRMPTQILPNLRNKFSQLNLSQWMYLLAIVLLLAHEEQDIQQISDLLSVGVIAGIGLLRELWLVFNRIWEHMLGKGLILVLYAATANFALAISALKINVITGIEPSPFIFTLGFATLIMLPFWLLVSSVIFFSIALVAGNLWLVVGVLLRLIRIKVKVHWEDKVFVFMTMILRLVLIPYVITSIVSMAIPYAKQIELFEKPIALLNKVSADEQDETQAPNDNVVLDEPEIVQFSINNRPFTIPVDEDGQIKWLDKLIAGFIYHFETYPKSACKKLPEERSLPIDENMILLVVEDDSVLGYEFSVGPCEGNFSDVEHKVEVETPPK